MPLLMPEMLDAGTVKDVQAAMQKDLRAAAQKLKGKDVFFVVAADVALADKTKVSLIVVSPREAELKAWQLKLKGKKPSVLTTGTCTLQTKDGKTIQVALDKIKGDRNATLKTAKVALKLNPAVKVSDALVKGEAEDDEAETEAVQAKSSAPKPGGNADEQVATLARELNVTPEQMKEISSLADELKVSPAKILQMLNEDKGLEAAATKLISELEEEGS